MEEKYRIAETINFPEEEEKVLQFWNENKVFEECLKQSKDKPRFVCFLPRLCVPLFDERLNVFPSDTPSMTDRHSLPACRITATYWPVQLRTL